MTGGANPSKKSSVTEVSLVLRFLGGVAFNLWVVGVLVDSTDPCNDDRNILVSENFPFMIERRFTKETMETMIINADKKPRRLPSWLVGSSKGWFPPAPLLKSSFCNGTAAGGGGSGGDTLINNHSPGQDTGNYWDIVSPAPELQMKENYLFLERFAEIKK